MLIFHLLLYENAQVIQDLDDYQVKNFGSHIEVLKQEEDQPVIYDFKLEDTEEVEKEMKIPTKWRKPPR